MNAETGNTPAPLVCVAERNPRIRAFLLKEFRRAGYRVQAASNDRELAAVAAAEPRPGVFVVDAGMPGLEQGLSGRSAALVRPLVAYVLLPDNEGHPLLAAASAVVEKGGDPGELFAVVERLLRPGAGGS
jgi:DNA-binding response OmpR family regulator